MSTRRVPHSPSVDDCRDSFDEDGMAPAPRARASKPRVSSLAPPSSAHFEVDGRRSTSDRPLSIASSGATTIKADTTPRQSMAGEAQLGLAYYAAGRSESFIRALGSVPQSSSSNGLWSTVARSDDVQHRPPAPIIPPKGGAHRKSPKPATGMLVPQASSSLAPATVSSPYGLYDASPAMLSASASETSLGRLPTATPPMSPYLRPLTSSASSAGSLEGMRAEDDAPLKESKTSRLISRLTHLAKSAGRSSEDVRPARYDPLTGRSRR
jgi:hypothetical protein